MKHMQNTISETSKITITISISFEDLDFVVAALGKSVCIMKIEGVKDGLRPV